MVDVPGRVNEIKALQLLAYLGRDNGTTRLLSEPLMLTFTLTSL